MDGSRWTRCLSTCTKRILAASCVVAVGVWTVPFGSAQPPKRSAAGESKPTSGSSSEPKSVSAPVLERRVTPPQTAARPPMDLHPASFQGIKPGESRSAVVAEKMGAPERKDRADGVDRWQYADVGPFSTVEFWLEDDTVTAIVAKLAEPMSADEVAKQLSLQQFRPVLVRDGEEVLGQAYPERGVLFSFDSDSKDRQVLQIALEPLTAEPFWLRAKGTDWRHASLVLADLAAARQLGWSEPEARWLEVELNSRLGRFDHAATLAENLEPQTPDQQILLAWLTAERGSIAEARTIAGRVLQNAQSDLEKAEAEHLIGNLTAVGLDRDLPSAVKHQTRALQLARPYLKDRDTQVRRAARRLLVDINLALAHHVASGPFEDRTNVAREWWSEAIKLAGEQPVFRQDTRLQVQLMQAVLAANAQLDKPVSPEIFAKRLQALVEKAAAQTDDPAELSWYKQQQALALVDAARTARKLGRFEDALQHARTARSLLMGLESSDPRIVYAQGCVEFIFGSVYAVHERDHEKACGFYDQALTFFRDPLPPTKAHETGIHGERFVSIGVSFWENDRRELAVQVTERGARLMETAVEHGLLDRRALSVPYGNLAAMQEALGNPDASQDYARKAAALSDDAPTRR